MPNKTVPELCSELDIIVEDIYGKSKTLAEWLVPNYPTSDGSRGIGGPESLIVQLERFINLSKQSANNLSAVIKAVEKG